MISCHIHLYPVVVVLLLRLLLRLVVVVVVVVVIPPLLPVLVFNHMKSTVVLKLCHGNQLWFPS